jgi:hypothetical protein
MNAWAGLCIYLFRSQDEVRENASGGPFGTRAVEKIIGLIHRIYDNCYSIDKVKQCVEKHAMAAGIMHKLGITITHQPRDNICRVSLAWADQSEQLIRLFDRDKFIDRLLRCSGLLPIIATTMIRQWIES